MKFKVAKSDLENALQVVTPSLDSSANQSITTHYVFRRVDDDKDESKYGVEVLTTSGMVFSSCPLIAEVSDPGDKGVFTIAGKRLKQWLQHVSDAALTFDLDDTTVIASAPKGIQTFQSLSPDRRYVWTQTVAAAKRTAILPAHRLAAALAYSAKFTSAKENAQPELSICEVKDGILYSTDKRAVTLIRVGGLEESSLRVHSNDVRGFLSFLGTCDSGDVEVLEHESHLVFRRGDGAVFGESRFQGAFPELKIGMDDADQHVWVLSKELISDAVGFLISGASENDNRLRMAPAKDDSVVVFSMLSATGRRTELRIPAENMSSGPDVPALPAAGFDIDHFCLSKVLGSWRGDEVRFGINRMGDRGFVRFVTEPDDKFLTIVAWLR